MVVAQPGVAEAGQQNIVRLLPIGLAVVSGEQPVSGQRPDPRQRLREVLGEPALVAQLLDQFLRTGVELPTPLLVGVEERAVQFAEEVDGQRVGSADQ